MVKVVDYLVAGMRIVIGLMFLASTLGLVQPPDEPRQLAAASIARICRFESEYDNFVFQAIDSLPRSSSQRKT